MRLNKLKRFINRNFCFLKMSLLQQKQGVIAVDACILFGANSSAFQMMLLRLWVIFFNVRKKNSVVAVDDCLIRR